MADIAQLVRASVCGTECRGFKSRYPPHYYANPENFKAMIGKIKISARRPRRLSF